MATTFQLKTLFSITLIFSIILTSYTKEIIMNTDMKKWKIRSKNEPAKTCDNAFTYANEIWKLSSCKNVGTNACVLETEKYTTTIVQELIIEIAVTTYESGKDLVIGYKATDKFNNVYHQIHDSSIPAERVNSEITFKHRINVTNYNDIAFEFSNFYGYCGQIKKLTVSYHTCDYEEDSLVNPVFHGTPSIKDKEIRLNATCKRNAVPTRGNLFYTCLPNGTVSQYGDCMCLSGFRVHKNECVKCPKYTYKPNPGNDECKTCGVHSYNSALRDNCVCRHGYYREVRQINNSSASCYSSKPFKLMITSISSDSAHIEWKVVNKSINWKKIHFTINCDNCLDNEGNFPFQTYRREIQLNDLEPSKKYVISVTASSEEGIAHTASTTIWGKFVTTHATYGKDIITITIISIIVPLVTITTTIFVYMYCRQRRKSEHLRKKISSLKRQRRPPKPPASPRYDDKYDIPDEKHNISDTMSDINPYAVYVPPTGFKLCDKATAKDIIVDMKDDDEKNKMISSEQYEAMDGAMCPDSSTQNTSTENPYIMPSWAPTSTNHSYVDIKDADTTAQLPSLLEELQPSYTNMDGKIASADDGINNDEERDIMPRNMTLIPLRPRQLLNDRSRATSLYKDVFGYALDMKELNAAKLNCHYMRYDRKKAMDFVALIKRSHSADDINELPLIL